MNVLSIVLVLLLVITLILLWTVFFRLKKSSDSLKSQKQQRDILEQKTQTWEAEKAELLKVKQKFEDKNRKLWQMSETVHKERKMVDEANEQLLQAKEKLEAEKKKLDEKVKKLWSTSTAIHKEKERINELKLVIEHKHQEILDSVNYAQRIQRALLANEQLLKQHLPDYFVLFEPKDIVSGDFYWAQVLDNGRFALVTADSTGHGVPGAIMSILNISCIEKAVQAEKLSEPSEILNSTRKKIIETLKKDGSAEGGKDGMDCSLIAFDFKNSTMSYSAANNPIWIVRQKSQSIGDVPDTASELIELDPDKMPVGKHDRDHVSFSQHEFALQKGDLIYALTDGYPDQFGGPKGKKFMYKKLKELILSMAQLSLADQKLVLQQSLGEWKGLLEQVDDITLIGVRV